MIPIGTAKCGQRAPPDDARIATLNETATAYTHTPHRRMSQTPANPARAAAEPANPSASCSGLPACRSAAEIAAVGTERNTTTHRIDKTSGRSTFIFSSRLLRAAQGGARSLFVVALGRRNEFLHCAAYGPVSLRDTNASA